MANTSLQMFWIATAQSGVEDDGFQMVVFPQMAAIKALDHFDQPSTITLTTDSEYVRKGITEWIENWKVRAIANKSRWYRYGVWAFSIRVAR